MIDREHALPLTRQAEVLKLSRSGLYYRPRPVAAADLAVMRRIDELHLDYPFAGSRMLRDLLRGEGVRIGRQRVATMMKRMGIQALYRRQHVPAGARPQDLPVSAAQAGGRAAEPGVGDGHHLRPHGARLRLSGRGRRLGKPPGSGLAALITMEVAFCLEAVEEALAKYGRPEIFNTDQGSQFTSAPFTGLLIDNAVQISMDGKGSWRDNVFVERLWRSVKYEEVYLRAYQSVREARASIGRYLDFYNRKRPHSSLDARTPDQVYFDHLPQAVAA